MLYFWLALVISAVFTSTLLILLAIVRRRLRYPEKSFKHSAINVLLTPLRHFKVKPFETGELTLENMLKWAMRRAKCTDFGDDNMNFVRNYNAIMESPLQQTQVYTNIGYISAKMEMTMTFARRLKLVEYFKNHPDIDTISIPKPVFVMGLPRSGTTFLHRLLSLDSKRVRAPLLWELLNPVPKVPITSSREVMDKDRESRAKFTRKLVATRKSLGDKALEHIHEIGADLPEECLMALTDELPISLQLLYSSYMQPHYYDNKIIDNAPAYMWYRKYLRLLSAQIGESKAPRSYMLKCPFHLFNVKEIKHAFPDATLIWTHRHPISAVPSLCSLLKAFHQLYYEKEGCDERQLGRTVKEISEKHLFECQKDIDATKLNCIHTIYNEIIADPIKLIKSIYSKCGWEFTSEYEAKLNEYLEENKRERDAMKKKKGNGRGAVLHSYSPEEFGLTEEQLSSGRFAEYCTRYSVPMSKN